MKLPFSTDEFLNVFQSYNLTFWPFQIFIFFAGILCVTTAIRNKPYSAKLISSILAFFWLWMGIAYHLMNFSSINKAAYLFGILFIIQSLIFIYYGVFKKDITFNTQNNFLTGLLLIIYSMIIYPMLGFLLDHSYPKSPTFGLPCPTTIFTLSILIWADKKFPVSVLIIPLLWSVIGFSAVLLLGIYEDTGLIITALISITLFATGKRKANKCIIRTEQKKMLP